MTIPKKLYTTYNIRDLEEEIIKAERYNDFARVASLQAYTQWVLLL